MFRMKKSFVQVFNRLALFQWVYLLAVIIYGAMVRATRSGAGCGAHWPLCNGEVLPRFTELATVIEFGHRISSGLCLPLALVVAVIGRRLRREYPMAYTCAWLTVGFVVIEALIGASLVLLEHVAYNTSAYRAVTISVHLLSSNLLIAFALLAWHLSRPASAFAQRAAALQQLRNGWLGLGLAVLVLTHFSGAFTVLADTLFPSQSIAHSLSEALLDSRHLFVRLRIFHPFIAMASGALLLMSMNWVHKHRLKGNIYQQAILALLLGQILLGLGNILWPASLGLQLGHLLGAELIWLSFVLFSSDCLQWGRSLR
jgi:heme a synthase